jgi:hypothetical protein
MNEPVRRNLLAGLDRKPAAAPADDAAIAAVAERHGFSRTDAPLPEPAAPSAPRPVPTESDTQQVTMRRRRKLLGRTQQFNVRLRPETVDTIYEEANGRDVPIAQVIEEMVEAFRVSKGRAAD